MKKKKSAHDILIEGIKNMPPIHVAYLMQRIQIFNKADNTDVSLVKYQREEV